MNDQSLGALAMDAVRSYEQLVANGMTKADALVSLERTIRAIWPKPKGRTEPWKFYCDDCLDTGWMVQTCTPETPCGRPFRLPNARLDDGTGKGRCTSGHSYARACWCAKGRAKQAQLEQRPPQEDFTAAGRSMTRVGRR